jgi:hypothetical protein
MIRHIDSPGGDKGATVCQASIRELGDIMKKYVALAFGLAFAVATFAMPGAAQAAAFGAPAAAQAVASDSTPSHDIATKKKSTKKKAKAAKPAR